MSADGQSELQRPNKPKELKYQIHINVHACIYISYIPRT